MITNIKTTVTMDVSKDNDVFNISRPKTSNSLKIACISWLSASSRLKESKIAVLRMIFRLFSEKLTGFCFLCLVGHSSWQPDSRIVRHRKLWGALKARGVEISHSSESCEEIVEQDGKIKFFGSKRISELSVESVINTITEEHCSYLVAFPEHKNINDVLHKGWTSNGLDEDLLQYVLNNGGVLIHVVGEFDDIEAGFVGFAEGKLIRKLSNKGQDSHKLKF